MCVLNGGIDAKTGLSFLDLLSTQNQKKTHTHTQTPKKRTTHTANADGTIEDAKFKTFGCGSAIASSSLVTEMIKGKNINDAMKVTNSDISKELNLPPVKIHCSVLAEEAIKAAVENYRSKSTKVKEAIL